MHYLVTPIQETTPMMGGGPGRFSFTVQAAPGVSDTLCITMTYNTKAEAEQAYEAAKNMVEHAMTIST
jgi:hypothetical protein